MRLLVSAYACEPGKGSEPGVGWTWVEMMSSFADVTVITRANNRDAIEAASLSESWVRDVGWVYHDLPRWAMALKKATGSTQGYYIAWQYTAARKIRAIIQTGEFDFVHHLTFGTYWLPYLTGRVDARSVIGPVGGAESAPLAYAADDVRSLLFEMTRSLARKVAEHVGGVRRPPRHADLCIAKAPETAARLDALGSRRTVVHSEVVLSSVPNQREDVNSESEVIQLISVGRLIHLKGYQLALQALAQARDSLPDFNYTVVGDGSYRAHLAALVARLGLEDVVTFAGNRDRDDVLRLLQAADVFIHPSLHDSGGWACVEAMWAGLPVICLDLGGPATQVSDDVGIRVPALSPRQTVDDLARAIARLCEDKELRKRMRASAQERVEALYTRESQTEWLRSTYGSLESGWAEE